MAHAYDIALKLLYALRVLELNVKRAVAVFVRHISKHCLFGLGVTRIRILLRMRKEHRLNTYNVRALHF